VLSQWLGIFADIPFLPHISTGVRDERPLWQIQSKNGTFGPSEKNMTPDKKSQSAPEVPSLGLKEGHHRSIAVSDKNNGRNASK
jgi:hypothetical protein